MSLRWYGQPLRLPAEGGVFARGMNAARFTPNDFYKAGAILLTAPRVYGIIHIANASCGGSLTMDGADGSIAGPSSKYPIFTKEQA